MGFWNEMLWNSTGWYQLQTQLAGPWKKAIKMYYAEGVVGSIPFTQRSPEPDIVLVNDVLEIVY